MDAVLVAFLSVAGFFTILATIWTSVLIYGHMRNYTNPEHQKYIIRILFMPIIYAVNSWLSLYFKHDSWSIFIDIGRDCYEAYVIYSFFKLLVSYLGGKDAVCNLVGKKPSFDFLPFYLAHDGHKFYHRRYVIMRPALAFVAAILNVFGKYGDGIYTWDKGFIYILILNNIAVTIALYCLGMFYQRFEAELKPHSPILKFMVIKGVVFFTFWQSVGIVILGWVGAIPSTAHHSSTTISFFINDTLICIEMFIAGIAHFYAFPYQQYQTTAARQENLMGVIKGKLTSATKKEHATEPSALAVLGEVTGQSDVVRDAVSSVAGPEGTFVEYRKFKDSDEVKNKFSIIKRHPTTIRSPLIVDKAGEPIDGENEEVGIEISDFTNYAKEDDFSKHSDGSDISDLRQTAHEFPPNATVSAILSPPLSKANPNSRNTKFGDAILTKPEDTEVHSAHYEINLL